MGLEGKGKSYYTETAQSRAQENLTVDSTIPLGTLERYSAGGVIREEDEEKENVMENENIKNTVITRQNLDENFLSAIYEGYLKKIEENPEKNPRIGQFVCLVLKPEANFNFLHIPKTDIDNKLLEYTANALKTFEEEKITPVKNTDGSMEFLDENRKSVTQELMYEVLLKIGQGENMLGDEDEAEIEKIIEESSINGKHDYFIWKNFKTFSEEISPDKTARLEYADTARQMATFSINGSDPINISFKENNEDIKEFLAAKGLSETESENLSKFAEKTFSYLDKTGIGTYKPGEMKRTGSIFSVSQQEKIREEEKALVLLFNRTAKGEWFIKENPKTISMPPCVFRAYSLTTGDITVPRITVLVNESRIIDNKLDFVKQFADSLAEAAEYQASKTGSNSLINEHLLDAASDMKRKVAMHSYNSTLFVDKNKLGAEFLNEFKKTKFYTSEREDPAMLYLRAKAAKAKLLSYENGDIKKRTKALDKYLSDLGVKNPAFPNPASYDLIKETVSALDKAIKEREENIKNMLERVRIKELSGSAKEQQKTRQEILEKENSKYDEFGRGR